MFSLCLALWVLDVFTRLARAQEHTVSMINNCGYGVATLDQIPSITLATGSQNYTNGTVEAVAFLNAGFCGPNGGNCTGVDLHLGNRADGSSAVIVDLVPTHKFSVPVSFSFFGACDGAGVSCLSSTCTNAMRDPEQQNGLVTCTSASPNFDSASVLVTFCPNTDLPVSVSSAQSSTTTASATATASSSSSAPASLTSSAKAGIIAAGVIGGLAFLIIALLVGLYIRRLKQRSFQYKEQLDSTATPYFLPPPPSAPSSGSESVYPIQDEPPRYELQSLKSSSNNRSSLQKTVIAPLRASSSLPLLSTQSNQSRDDTTGRRTSTNPDDDRNLDTIVERLADRLGVRHEMLPRYDEEMQREVGTNTGRAES